MIYSLVESFNEVNLWAIFDISLKGEFGSASVMCAQKDWRG